MPLTGLIAAPHTPFHPDGSLNSDAIPRQCDHLLRVGVAGAFVCGTTGEGMSLTSPERRTVAERWVAAAAGRFPVVVHVGHASQAEARELAAHAEGVGAAAVAAVAPFYHKPAGVGDLARFLAGVAAGAPRLPFYYYDIPGVAGVALPAAEVVRQLADAVPKFAGVKFSHRDLVALQECLALGDRCEVLFGVDEMLLAAVALGVRGAVGSTYNWAAPLYRRMLAAADAGDWPAARALQRQSVALGRAVERAGGLPANKAVMALVGVDCGPVRPPLRPLPPAETASLRGQLEAAGLFSPGVSAPG